MDNSENVIVLSPDDFQNLCRTCLSQDQLESIFSDDTNFSVVNMLMAVADVHISGTDNLPSKICTSCMKTLNLAFRFKQQCEEAEYKLKEFLNTYKIINKTDNTENVETISTVKKEEDFQNEISSNSNIDKFDGTNGLAFSQMIDTDVLVESFVGIIYDKDNENLCEEIIEEVEDNQISNQSHQIEEEIIQKAKKGQFGMKECPYCKKLIKRTHLKEHIQGIHLMIKYECDKCDQKFSFRSNYIRHAKLHDDNGQKVEKPIQFKACPTCGKFINIKRLNSHIRLLHSKEKFQCELCHQKFSIRSNYVRHLKIHTGERPYTCETCGKGFIQMYALKEHRRVHTQERPYKCKLCEKSFSQSNSFNKHQKDVHNLEMSAKNNEQFTCQTCTEVFTSSLALNAHSRVHLTKPFYCDKCSNQYTTKKHLDDHNCVDKSINDIRKEVLGVFNCEECGKKFSSKHSLVAHKYLYHSDIVHLCNFCGKNCISTTQLKKHLVVHSEERPFKCHFCSKAFKTKMTLKVHNLLHTGERPYSCTQCDKTFHQGAHLRAHRRTHTGEKPYNCVICSKNFASKINYTVHMRIHSGETPYVCPICNKGFHHSSGRKKHLRIHNNQNKMQE